MELGEKYNLVAASDFNHTKSRIIIEATRLFATRGYDNVTIREVAASVGIKSATLYSYFESKEDILESVLQNFKFLYRAYFQRLTKANEKAESMDEVLDNMFVELKHIAEIFNFYNISLVQQVKFRNETAKDLYVNLLHGESINYIKESFDDMVERGLAPEFDTWAVAAIFMHTVMVTNELRIHEHMGEPLPFDMTNLQDIIHSVLYQAIKNGLPVRAVRV